MRGYFVIMKLLLLLITCLTSNIIAQHEKIPYASVDKICEKCICQSTRTSDNNNQYRHILNCPNKGLNHILPRWPQEFGINHEGVEIQATFSRNNIPLLQQLPQSRGIISFSCINCQIKEIQASTFIDCPNILRLNLRYNQLNSDSLNPDIFRGPYNETVYEPIGLQYLDLSYNLIDTLDLRLFEHTPNLKELLLTGNKFLKIDTASSNAIGLARNLEYLDLSFNNLKILPNEIFIHLFKLKSLFIQGNQFQFIPDALKKITGSLENLDISDNLIKHLNVSSFDGLINLQHLNISSTISLTAVEDGTFDTLKNLQNLFASNNENLSKFHLPTSSGNLIKLDISNCKLKSVILDVDLLHVNTNYWPKLKLLDLYDNPWHCDCNLMKFVQQFKHIITFEKYRTPKCSSPYDLDGVNFVNLSTDSLCEVTEIKNIEMQPLRAHTFNTPYFLRSRSIGVTLVMLSIVIVLGIIVGLGIVLIRQRLKHNTFGLNTQIRYTTVRSI